MKVGLIRNKNTCRAPTDAHLGDKILLTPVMGVFTFKTKAGKKVKSSAKPLAVEWCLAPSLL